MSFPSDLEIARAVTPRPIGDVAADLGLRSAELELYGPTKAKVTLAGVERVEGRKIWVWATSACAGVPLAEASIVFIAPKHGGRPR